MKANQEETKVTIRAGQEKLEATVSGIWYAEMECVRFLNTEFQETQLNVKARRISLDEWTQSLCKELSRNIWRMKKKLHRKFNMEIQAARLDTKVTRILIEATQRKLGTCLAEVKV